MPGVQYRLFHELKDVWHPLEFEGGKIAVNQLKEQISRTCGLAKDSNRRFILQLSDAQTNTAFRDDDSVPIGSRIVAKILNSQQSETIKHAAKTHCTDSDQPVVNGASIGKPLPAPYVCAICKSLLRIPVQLRCSGECNNKTVCKVHINRLMLAQQSRPESHCPIDGPAGKPRNPYTIHNRVIAEHIKTLARETFYIPTPTVDPDPELEQDVKKEPESVSRSGDVDVRGSNDFAIDQVNNSAVTNTQPPTMSDATTMPCHNNAVREHDAVQIAPPPQTGHGGFLVSLSFNPFLEFIAHVPFLSDRKFNRLKREQQAMKAKISKDLYNVELPITPSSSNSTNNKRRRKREDSDGERKKKSKRRKREKREKRRLKKENKKRQSESAQKSDISVKEEVVVKEEVPNE
eukprot:Selendium_serpulae@DN5107_c0_g1_i2.p1